MMMMMRGKEIGKHENTFKIHTCKIKIDYVYILLIKIVVFYPQVDDRDAAK